MAKKSTKKLAKQKSLQENISDAWISMRTGLIVMALVSVALAVWIAWNAVPTQGTVNGILWGIGFGAAVWVVFLIALTFNRFVRGKK